MGCFGACFRGFRKSCGEFRARLYRRLVRGKVAPQGTSDVASSEMGKQQVTSSCQPLVDGEDRDIRTPEALNQVVEEFVSEEIRKIQLLAEILSEEVAEDLMARGASIDEINEAASKERKDEHTTVES